MGPAAPPPTPRTGYVHHPPKQDSWLTSGLSQKSMTQPGARTNPAAQEAPRTVQEYGMQSWKDLDFASKPGSCDPR